MKQTVTHRPSLSLVPRDTTVTLFPDDVVEETAGALVAEGFESPDVKFLADPGPGRAQVMSAMRRMETRAS